MGDSEDVKDEDRKSKVSIRGSKSALHVRSQTQQKSLSRLKMRKGSYGFSSVHGIRPVDRNSQIAVELKRPHLMYLPTYQLESRYPFDVNLVQKATEATIQEHFTGHIYHMQASPTLALRVASEIMKKVKAMNFNRYRCIAVVTIRQKRAQCYNNAIAFLWDHERDRYVDTYQEVTTAFIQATVFGVYLD